MAATSCSVAGLPAPPAAARAAQPRRRRQHAGALGALRLRGSAAPRQRCCGLPAAPAGRQACRPTGNAGLLEPASACLPALALQLPSHKAPQPHIALPKAQSERATHNALEY